MLRLAINLYKEKTSFILFFTLLKQIIYIIILYILLLYLLFSYNFIALEWNTYLKTYVTQVFNI